MGHETGYILGGLVLYLFGLVLLERSLIEDRPFGLFLFVVLHPY
jgi:hypothetical protein